MRFQHGASAIDESTVFIDDSSDVTFSDNVIAMNNWGGLLILASSNISIFGTTVNENGGRGIVASRVTGLLLADNETSRNNWRGAPAGYVEWSASGLKVLLIHGGAIVNHLSEDNQASGIWLDTDNKDVTLDGIVSRGNLTDGLILEANQGPVLVINSMIADNGRWGISSLNSIGLSVVDSHFCDNSESQIRIRNQTEARTVRDWETQETLALPPASGWEFSRNVVVSDASNAVLFGIASGTYQEQFIATLNSDGNVWHGRGSANLFTLGDGMRLDLNEWQLLTGQDANSAAEKPKQSCTR